MLYLIEILHQTTTLRVERTTCLSCILSKFYIKPQLCLLSVSKVVRCILSKFYIKPQLSRVYWYIRIVVSYRNSTSNHNSSTNKSSSPAVVSYRNSTSNHNENRPEQSEGALYLIEILHQTTTIVEVSRLVALLYLIEILHQTTTVGLLGVCLPGCILSKFYIKPQHHLPGQY